MTSYQGGKRRLGKKIYEAIVNYEAKNSNNKLDYFEPFCGMCGVLKHFTLENNRNIYACDLNKDIILMWKAVQQGWIPPSSCSKLKYNKLKNSPIPSAERGFIGTTCSFSGIFFKGGYRSKSQNYNFCKSGKKGVLELGKALHNTKFLNAQSYDSFEPSGMLIYCDPPYLSNKINSQLFQNFDHEKFWNIMRKWSKNNLVVISERTAPKDFKCIWNTDYKTSHLNQGTMANNKKIHNECLFVIND